MPEPFKNLFNLKVIKNMAEHFNKHWPEFNVRGFVNAAGNDLNSLELKARSQQITQAMIKYLPVDFMEAGKIMHDSLGPAQSQEIFKGESDQNGLSGWAIMPMSHYVGLQGHEHFELSMQLLKEMTKRFSSEFAIRFFILKSPQETLAVLNNWVNDENQHVRRLVSEGLRPRLPWAMQLPLFIKDPAPVIDLLEKLKDDPAEYVRRSVANNLNDIAKDHPDLVADLASRWIKAASLERKKLIRHACRTLLKNGHKKTLKVWGFKPSIIKQAKLDLLTTKVIFGQAIKFTFSICSDTVHDQNLMVDYIIHHQKANGSMTPKVFKWRTVILPGKKVITYSKKHVFKKITTRVYYAGLHKLEIVVNGVSVAERDFQLLIT